MEIRTCNAELRAEGNHIIGLAAPVWDGSPGSEYRLWDHTYERFAPGAFREHLATNPDIKCRIEHKKTIARTSAGTLRVWEEARGIAYDACPPDTAVVRDLKADIESKNISGSSFAFEPIDIEWTTDGKKDIRLIRKAKIYDVAPTEAPAYSGSTLGLRHELRSEERAKLEQERDDYRARLETEKRLARIEQLLTK